MRNILRLGGVFLVLGWFGLGMVRGAGETISHPDALLSEQTERHAPGQHVLLGEQLPADYYTKLFEKLHATRGTTTFREVNLTDSAADDKDPAWSPAGDTIIFSSNGLDTDNDGKFDGVGDNYNLWQMRPDGGQLRQVTNDPLNEWEPAWAPSGREIAFVSDRTGTPQIFTHDMATGDEVLVTAGAEASPGNKAHPAFGSLGIFFVSSANGNWDLWFIQTDGSGLKQLTYSAADDVQPKFGLDNMTVAFASNRTGTYRIYTIPSSNVTLPDDQRSGEPGLTQRTSGGGAGVNDTEPSFRLADKSLVFTSDRPVSGSPTNLNVWRGNRNVNLLAAGTWDTDTVLVENFRTGDQAADQNATGSMVSSYMAEKPSEPYRIIFQTNRGGNWDIWSIIPDLDDVEPPKLSVAGTSILPTESPKVASAGVPVTIRAWVEDNFDEWHLVLDLGTYDIPSNTFTDGQAIQPPPPDDAVDLEAVVLDNIVGTCAVTVTGVNQNNVAGRVWTGVADGLGRGLKFTLNPVYAGDRCKDVTSILVAGSATLGGFVVRPRRDRVNPSGTGTTLVQAVFRVPYEFTYEFSGNGSDHYQIDRVYTHTDHIYGNGHDTVTDTNIALASPWPRFSGPAAPEAGRIDLRDDGVAPDEVAWDGLYTGTWVPPRDTDYFLDIAVQDAAANDFIYDNVGGLSRRPFSPSNPPADLLVLDWTEGQRWTANELGPYYSAVPAEMHWLGYTGTEILAEDPDKTPPTEDSDLWNWSIWNDNHLNNRYNSWVPRDIWRTQCRGAVPASVLAAYLPRIQMQPDPTDPLFRPTKAVADAHSCVVWAAPYTGDEWVQPGSSIISQTVQESLTSFVENGGRLWVSGGDIAWALTGDGSIDNAFLRNVLGATYASDWGVNVLNAPGPLGTDPTEVPGYWPWWDLVPPPDSDPPRTLWLTTWPWYTMGNPPVTLAGDAAPQYIGDPANDTVVPIPPAQVHYSYQGGGAGGTYLERTGQSGVKTRTIYSSFGFEAIHRGYVEKAWPPPPPPPSVEYCKNYRGKVWHDFICWLTTWRLTGRVIHNQGLQPIPKTLILVDPTIGPDGGLTLNAPMAAVSSDDGTFQVEGLTPGAHSLWVYAPGFFWHYYGVGGRIHGQSEFAGADFKLTEAEPGGISGTVTILGSGAPINGATVTATLIGYYLGQPLQVTAQTNAEGFYRITRLPTGFYNVSATAPGFGEATVEQVEVKSGTVTENVNLALPAAPGSLSGTVTVLATGAAIPNATIEAVAGGQVTGTATTDADGHYEIAEIAAGTHQVTASAPGYGSATKAVTIEPSQAKVVDFALSTVPPGSVSGVVKEAATGDPSDEATVRVFSGETEIASTVTSGQLTTENGYSFNYRLQVPAGTYDVRVSKPSRTPVPEFRTVTVVSEQETKNVNFQLEPIHSFAAGVFLISFPYQYFGPALDPATIMGLSQAALTGNLAWWNGTAYAMYPTPPTNAAALGQGYFVRLADTAVVEQEGAASTADPFVIPLRVGWNMIGDPFLSSVDWYTVQVRVVGGNVLTMPDALAQGVIRGRLWSFDGRQYRITLFMNPWVGNWVQATQAVELLVPAPARAVAARTEVRAARVVENGWGFGLSAAVGQAAGVIYLGSSPAGREGYDPLDGLQPPTIMGESPVDIYYDEPGWQANSGRYAVEVKGDVSSGRKRWDFKVETRVAQSTVRLSWPDLKEVPGDVVLTLKDLDTGQLQNMRWSTSYQFNSGSGGVRHFAVEAERRTKGSMLVSGLAVLGQTKARVLDISFTLSQPGLVTVEIFNLVGERVRVVKSDAAMAAGLNDVVWDGRNERGAYVPSANYICQVTAKNEAGEIVNVFRPFVVAW